MDAVLTLTARQFFAPTAKGWPAISARGPVPGPFFLAREDGAHLASVRGQVRSFATLNAVARELARHQVPRFVVQLSGLDP